MSAFEVLAWYLAYPFVRHAFVVGALVALCASLLGTTLVTKRLSYIGDGLSHVAFGAYAAAAAANVSQSMPVVVAFTVAVAVLLLWRGGRSQVRGDAALAMLSVTSLAGGYLLLNTFGTSANVSGDVCSTLFGSTSILTLTSGEVVACAVLAIVVVGTFALLYERIFAITFDETFARACGLPVGRYDLVVAVMIALTVVVGMRLVGALLLSALVVFPALAAMRVCDTFRGVTVCSAVLAVACALLGMATSIVLGTPVGSTIVMVNGAAYLLCCAVGKVGGGGA